MMGRRPRPQAHLDEGHHPAAAQPQRDCSHPTPKEKLLHFCPMMLRGSSSPGQAFLAQLD